jgi:NDP-sugar pyrophosphorylase family protein
VGLGAVLVLGNDNERGWTTGRPGQESWLTRPMACVNIMGRTMVERTIRNLSNINLEAITVLATVEPPAELLRLRSDFANLNIQTVPDLSVATGETLDEYSRNGMAHAFIVSADCYAETDLLDFFFFHREGRQKVTRALDPGGPLDMWVVDCKRAAAHGIENLLKKSNGSAASYYVAGYVRRLKHAQDLRQIIVDSLSGVCALRPSGQEVKPGIWVDVGAEVDRRARIVAPAYIGRGSTVREDTLVTRCSSIERDCYVDYGTVIEDSSILANTRVGIWLDVLHAVASGNKMQSLKHDVLLEIPDPGVMRWNGAALEEIQGDLTAGRQPEEVPVIVPDRQTEGTATSKWQFGANPIQG